MSLAVAVILGVVVGYGLCSLREAVRIRACEQDCVALQMMLQRSLEQDAQIASLFATAERMAHQIVLQDRVDATRNGVQG